MTTYAFRDGIGGDVVLLAPHLSPPRPAHALTPAAADAVETVRRIGRETRLQREAARLVTDAGATPPVEPYLIPEIRRWTTKKGKRKSEPTGRMIPGDVVTRNARNLQRDAEAAGFEVLLLEYRAGCRVEGIHRARRVGFTATWTRGRADGASWHEPWKYAIAHDPRPVGVSARAGVALAGKRGAGLDALHLRIVASPLGLPISQAELRERIKP